MVVTTIYDKDDFYSALESAGEKLVIVDFYADWCGPCKMISPKLEALSNESNNYNIVFLKVNVDSNADLSGEYQVQSIPSFAFIKKKQKIDSFSGASEEKLKELISKYKTV